MNSRADAEHRPEMTTRQRVKLEGMG